MGYARPGDNDESSKPHHRHGGHTLDAARCATFAGLRGTGPNERHDRKAERGPGFRSRGRPLVEAFYPVVRVDHIGGGEEHPGAE